jgi:glycosyltransferase involved in cell wall biosynthesis
MPVDQAPDFTSISVVIPVYNGEKTLEELTQRISEQLKGLAQTWEIVFVNDHSSDNSMNVLEKLYVKDPQHIKIISFAKNFGQHNAIICGFEYCSGDVVITMDDDLQHPPEEIPNLVDPLRANPGLEVVIGIPEAAQKSYLKKLGSALLNILVSKIQNKPRNLKMASFRAMRSKLAKQLADTRTSTPAIGSLILSQTRQILNVKVRNEVRRFGNSGYSLGKSARLFLNNLMHHSALPLKAVSMLGLLSSLVGFGLSIFYLVRYFTGAIAVPGWTTLVLLLLIFNGIILLSIGIIGEYLIRIITEVNGSPRYVIHKKEGFK